MNQKIKSLKDPMDSHPIFENSDFFLETCKNFVKGGIEDFRSLQIVSGLNIYLFYSFRPINSNFYKTGYLRAPLLHIGDGIPIYEVRSSNATVEMSIDAMHGFMEEIG